MSEEVDVDAVADEEPSSPKEPSGGRRHSMSRRKSKSGWGRAQDAVFGADPRGAVDGVNSAGSGGGFGGTALLRVTQEATEREYGEGYGGDLKLWQAAQEGNAEEVEHWLRVGADWSWTMPDSSEKPLRYKNRKVSSQAIHAAASADPRVQLEYRRKNPDRAEVEVCGGSYHCVEALIKARADVRAKAKTKDGGKERLCEAIHIAAGSGNHEIVRLLVENSANPESEATVDGKLHYYPIHDAVWFNQIKSVKMLLQRKAKVHAENNDKNTALHLAAMLGHDDMVEFLLYERTTFLKMKDGTSKKDGAKRENKLLVTSTNREGKDALQLAVEKGQFSAFRLNLFTNAQLLDIESGDRAEAFLQVARNCPDAATALLRSEYPDSKHARNFADGFDEVEVRSIPISPSWTFSIQSAVNREPPVITVKKLCELIEVAPQSAVDLLDMLTAKPKEGNKFHRPLPVRANIPVDQEACRLSCVYITEMEWTWNASETKPPAWQDQLAPPDPKKSQEVTVRVLLLPGVLNCEMVHCLAATRDQRIFTKLVIHALLKHLWQAFRPMFLIDLAHQILANAVICYWIWGAGQVEAPKMLRCALWGLLASEGVSECFTFVWTFVHGYKRLSAGLLYRWVKRAAARAVVGTFALSLAVETAAEFQPVENGSILLSINSLLHWLLILTEIRAFRATGRRILPIMKSVTPIAGMLLIMCSITLAFLHAFWAMDRADINEISMFNIVVLLFTGEQFLSGDDLALMPDRQRITIILLSIGGVFIFLTCTINVFIAVLCECYDQEQERMVCTFLKERARICSGYFLRPKMKATGFSFLSQEIRKLTWWRWILLLVVVVVFYGVTLFLISEADIVTAWFGAVYPSLSVLCVQSIFRDCATTNWKKSYLWLCHEKSIDEETFLAPEQRDDEDHSGRLTQVKKFIRERMKATMQKVQYLQMSVNGVKKEMDCQKELLQRISTQVGCLPPPAEDIPIPIFQKDKKSKHSRTPGSPREYNAGSPPKKTPARAHGGETAEHPLGAAGKHRKVTEPSSPRSPRAQTELPANPEEVPTIKNAEQLEQLRLHLNLADGQPCNAGPANAEALKALQQEIQGLRDEIRQHKASSDDIQRNCQEVRETLSRIITMAEQNSEQRRRRGPPDHVPFGDVHEGVGGGTFSPSAARGGASVPSCAGGPAFSPSACAGGAVFQTSAGAAGGAAFSPSVCTGGAAFQTSAGTGGPFFSPAEGAGGLSFSPSAGAGGLCFSPSAGGGPAFSPSAGGGGPCFNPFAGGGTQPTGAPSFSPSGAGQLSGVFPPPTGTGPPLSPHPPSGPVFVLEPRVQGTSGVAPQTQATGQSTIYQPPDIPSVAGSTTEFDLEGGRSNDIHVCVAESQIQPG